MNVLYVSIKFPRENEGDNLYTDLAEEINKNNNITVVVAEEKKHISKTTLQKERNMNVLRVKVGNFYNVSLMEKAITYISMQNKLKKAIKQNLKEDKFQIIIYTSPPVTLCSVIKYTIKKYNAISFLMQKDIFPQNAIDLKMMSKCNPIYWYFRYKEKKLYKISNYIGCMSQGNINYILNHNKYIAKEKCILFPNTRKRKKEELCNNFDIYKKYNIPKKCVIALYGGNFGKPQGIDFIIKILNNYKEKDVFFILIGNGTEKGKLFDYVKKEKITNVITIDFLPEKEYKKILSKTDIGLVFLDYRFTIPNIPSRTLSYFEYAIPIMAATDKNTDYRKILVEDAKAGLWCESNNIEAFTEKFDYLLKNKKVRKNMGINGRKYFENNLTTEKSVKILKQILKQKR